MTVPPCGHGMMTQMGTSRNSRLVPYTLQLFKGLTPEGKHFEGIRAYGEPFLMERRVCLSGTLSTTEYRSHDKNQPMRT